MQEATMGMTQQAMGENPGDEQLLVRFFFKPVEDKAASKEEGRPIFNEVAHIDIRAPGNRKTGVARPARDKDKQRFPRHWSAFEQRVEMPETGYPLREWSEITRAVVDEMSFMNVKTVEQLAAVSDTHICKMNGGVTYREMAKKFLERSGVEYEAARFQGLEEENAELKTQLLALTEQVAKLVDAQE